MFGDEITLTLNSPITDEQFDALTDVDMENTPRIVFHTKNGKEVEYIKPVRCDKCEHFHPIKDGLFGNCDFGHGVTDVEFYCRDGDRRSE